MSERSRWKIPELSVGAKVALGVFAVAFFAYLSQYAPFVGASYAENTNDTIVYPIASSWNSASGEYIFNLDEARLIESVVRDESGNIVTVDAEVLGNHLLCENSPDAPICRKLGEILPNIGVSDDQISSYQDYTLVVKEGDLKTLCSPSASACLKPGWPQSDLNGESPWLIFSDRPYGPYWDETVFAHELTHQIIFNGLPGDGLDNIDHTEVVGADNLAVDNSCMHLTFYGGSVCTGSSDNKSSICTPVSTEELEAVVSSRRYMIDYVDPLCWDSTYTESHRYCSGGYSDIFNFGQPNIAGLADRRDVVFGVDELVQKLNYKEWIGAKREGRIVDAFNLLVSDTSLNEMTPEEIMKYLGALNSALVGYDISTLPSTEAPYIIDRPINQVCGVE